MSARSRREASATTPFEFQKALSVAEIGKSVKDRERAPKLFCEDVHDYCGWTPEELFIEPRPRILCRPSGEGKTTELNYIQHKFRLFRPPAPKARPIRIEFDRSWAQCIRADLVTLLRDRLQVSRGATLHDIIEAVESGTTLLLFDNIEHLSQDAFHWLLHSLHHLEQYTPHLLAEKRVFIGLSGSLGRGHLSRDVYSLYYDARVRDYSDENLLEIKTLIRSRLGVEMTDAGLGALATCTGFEKRMTNLLLDLCIVRRMQAVGGDPDRELSTDDVEAALQHHVEISFRNDGRWMRAVQELVSEPAARLAAELLARNGETEWGGMPPIARKLLDSLGLIEVSGGLARPRNRAVHMLLERASDRFQRAKRLLREYLPRGPLLGAAARRDRGARMARMVTDAFLGSVLWIYYGEVMELCGDHARVFLVDDDLNEFEADFFAADLGMELSPGQGFLKYALATPAGPREEYYFYA